MRHIKAGAFSEWLVAGMLPSVPPERPPRLGLVVVVDDDPAVRNSLKFALEIEGYRVRLFRSGADLLDLADLPTASCVVVDYNLKGENGLDVIATLRGRNYATPAVLITSNPTPFLQQRAAAAGVPIVEKPLLGNALVDAIGSLADDKRNGAG